MRSENHHIPTNYMAKRLVGFLCNTHTLLTQSDKREVSFNRRLMAAHCSFHGRPSRSFLGPYLVLQNKKPKSRSTSTIGLALDS